MDVNVVCWFCHFLPLQAAIKASVLTGSDEGVGGGCGRGDFRAPLCGAKGDGVDLHTKYSVLGEGVSDRSAKSVDVHGAGDRATSVW